MKRKLTTVICILILLLAVFMPLAENNIKIRGQLDIIKDKTPENHGLLSLCIDGEIIYVDDDNTDGPWDGTWSHPYQYIQNGIDNATIDDIVYVFNGTYCENIIINRSITLTGENKEKTIVDGMYNDTIIDIQSNGVLVENFTIRNSGGYNHNAGISSNADEVTIKNCIIYKTKTGIFINNTFSDTISNCTIYSNGEGILSRSSTATLIEGCSIYHNALGIHLEKDTTSSITYCYLHTNGLSGLFNASSDIVIQHCNISDNSDNHGGMFFTGCSNSTISNSIFRHSGMGVNIANSKLINILKCTFYLNTHFAILVKLASHDITISQCEISHNFRFGIYAIDNSKCTISNNNIYCNTLHGLYLEKSQCNARNNWWGSFSGPSFTEFGRGDQINWKPFSIQFVPWAVKPLDNVGANWKINEDYMNDRTMVNVEKEIDIAGNDTDDDGIPDWWEEKYGYDPYSWDNHTVLDPDGDGLNNVEECFTDQWGSNPYHKDIFIEFDWTEPKCPTSPSNKPPSDLLNELIAIFDQHNITLHVDTGELGGGEEIPYISNFSFADMKDIYWNYFLHNNLNAPRKGIFHYGIICDYGPDLNFPFVGWDNLDSFLISAQWMHEMMPYYSLGRLIVGGTAHQLGSSLGLLADVYGGNDNLIAAKPFNMQWWKYHNYKSCMNYYYKYKLLSYSDGSHGKGDFNDWDHLKLDFFKNSHFEWPKM